MSQFSHVLTFPQHCVLKAPHEGKPGEKPRVSKALPHRESTRRSSHGAPVYLGQEHAGMMANRRIAGGTGAKVQTRWSSVLLRLVGWQSARLHHLIHQVGVKLELRSYSL